jgi:uncharacterized protein YhaN
VRIIGLRVDGYGILSDLEIDDLSPDLTVIYGPNEAGKSTLLDFVRGVLFGFPSRRHRQSFREPLRGGRHGGTIRFIDDTGKNWTLTRYVGAHQAELFDQSGAIAQNEEITRLLGGADDALFSSVFAFGLSELASLETLERDEVRELVFSAGVLGAGRSATQAVRSLDARQGLIIRPRQPDATANQLRHRFEANETALREARARAQGYPALQGECERIGDTVRQVRETAEQAHRRFGELDRMITCWPIWKRGLDARQRLSSDGIEDEIANPIYALEPAVRQLSGDLSGHLERQHQLVNLERQLVGIERELSSLLEDIGGNLDTTAIMAIDAGLATRDRVTSLTTAYRELHAELSHLEADTNGAKSEFERAEEILEELSSAHEVRSDGELIELSSVLFELRQRVAERDAAQLDEALTRTTIVRSRVGFHGARWLVAGATLGALFTVVAVAFGYRRELIVAIAFILAAVIAVAIGAWVAQRSNARLAHMAQSTTGIGEETGGPGDVISQLTHRLDPALRPNQADIERFAQRFEQERVKRRQIDEAARELMRAKRRLDTALARLADRQSRLESCEEALAREAAILGFSSGLSPSGLESAVEALRKTQDRIAAKRRVSDELSALRTAISGFNERLDTLCKSAAVDASSFLTPSDAIALLESRLEEALGDARLRRELNQIVDSADEYLDEAFGSGPDASRMRAELARGVVLDWEEQRRRLLDEIRDAEARYEVLLGAHRDAQRDLETLLSSDEIAALEFEHGVLDAELDEALRNWAALGIAQTLLERTLGRYERDRQPIVIARAGELFCDVTGGRYVQIVARESDEGGRSHGIQAITESGAHVDAGDLSRGTAEQLYICLRLAFAATFAERAVALPLVLDDVLVNFDPDRAQAVAHAIAMTAVNHQVLAFTCHPHVVEYLSNARAGMKVIKLERIR